MTNEAGSAASSPSGIGRRAAVGVAVLVLAVGGLVIWSISQSPHNDVRPEDAAHAWGDKLHLPVRGAACTMFDTDGDGYVSCVLALDGPEKVYFQGLQCGEHRSTKGGGCKVDTKNAEVKLAFDIATRPSAAPPSAPPPPEARAK